MTLKNDWVNGDFFQADDQNDVADEVNGKVDGTRTITAGTGLTGGGDLSANRTVSADFGTAAGKVCQGNDSRLSDARTPTTHTHSASDTTSGSFDPARIPAPSSDSVTSGSTLTAAITSPRHRYYCTALAADATIASPTGSPANGWQLVYRIKDNGTSRALTWNSVFRAVGVALPTSTVVSKTLYVACEYNSADSKFDVLAVAREA